MFAKKKQYKLRYSSHWSRKETVQSIKENLLFLSNQQVMKEQKKKIFDYGFMVFCFKLKSMLIAQCIKRHENSGKPLHVHHFSNHLKCSINREKALEKRGFHNCWFTCTPHYQRKIDVTVSNFVYFLWIMLPQLCYC